MASSMSISAPLHLPSELTIYTVGELHPHWLVWMAIDDQAPVLEGGDVDQVDAAGLQLLLALQRALTERGRSLVLRSPSTALREACAALGLADWLAQHGEKVCA